MKFKNEIAAHGGIAQKLAAQRKDLLARMPFGSELERTRYDLDHIAAPVVAVAGAYSTGKSTLINRLCGAKVLPVGVTPTTLVPILLRGGETERCEVGTEEGVRPASPEELHTLVTAKESPARYILFESPRARQLPWQWLDVPGTNTETRKKDGELKLRPQDLADVCIFATSALQPLTLSDVDQLLQLSELFPDGVLCIALTRWDQLKGESEQQAVLGYVQEMLASTLPGRKLAIFSSSEDGLKELRSYLAATVHRLQREQLKAALAAWKSTLEDLRSLLEMRELTEVKPETIERLQRRLDDLIVESGVQLKAELPGFMEQTVRALAARLPAPQRDMHEAFRKTFAARFGPLFQALGQRIDSELMAELRKDLTKQTSVTLANRFVRLLDSGDPFFDWSSATTAGAAGLGAAALIAAVSVTPIGWALAGGAVLGGLLGGFMGKASSIDTAAELRAKVAQPLSGEYEQALAGAIARYRADLRQLCRLMKQVISVFSGPNGQAYMEANPDRMVMLIKAAELQRGHLAKEFDKVEADRLIAEIAAVQQNVVRKEAPGSAIAKTKPASRKSNKNA